MVSFFKVPDLLSQMEVLNKFWKESSWVRVFRMIAAAIMLDLMIIGVWTQGSAFFTARVIASGISFVALWIWSGVDESSLLDDDAEHNKEQDKTEEEDNATIDEKDDKEEEEDDKNKDESIPRRRSLRKRKATVTFADDKNDDDKSEEKDDVNEKMSKSD